ncbi:BamA/TamA family outer membrane protein [Luteolibacter yonseiensis]|uniref:BamA/TamA family outer membrane protein n=1 Tax=Luteolibacter yonseiensis TaxID=1144680 RepID=A0A934R7K0_9BACT|nr:BamA/TamA family outer membrane protein [Luteolibacter yonseiensis]MBK1817772.1 BamA/TamA family outer membrane protein [Luteolibacter yonseiensis]
MMRRTFPILMLTALAATAETRIHITGLTRKSEGNVLDLMGGRLEYVRNNQASASSADDAAFLLTQVLRKDGYADVRVSSKIVSRDEILLTVYEGRRFSLGTVTVRGVDSDQAPKLAKIYAAPAEKARPLGAGSAPFREEDVEKGVSNIRQQLNSQGYWSAEVTIASRNTDPVEERVDLAIDVVTGPLFRISPAKIFSPDNRGVIRTKTTVDPFIGKEATTANLNAMRLAVEEAFNSRGYPDSRITMGRILEAPKFIPDFYIDLGNRVRLNNVRIEGLERTNPKRIAQRMKVLEGEWYDEAAMNKRIRGFLATGAFSSATVERVPVSEKRIDALLHFDETRAREISGAAGVDSYHGPLFRVSYADRNLFGQLLGFSSGFEFSARGILGETKLTDPWMWGSDVSGTVRAYALFYGREGYTALETGLEGKVNWKLGDHYSLEVLAGTSIVNLEPDGLPPAELGETVYGNPRLRFTQTLDYRDSTVLPKKGWHLDSPLEIGAAVGDLTTSYVKGGVNGGWYHPINANYSVGLGGEFGMLVPTGDGENLPIDLRMFNGGARSVRSFPERELGPTVNGHPTGGEAAWNANAELIRSITGSVSAVVFLDAGALSREYYELSQSELEMAVGLGVRLNLPIGPVRLEYGYNLTQDPGEPVGTLHFAIGTAY